MTFWTIITVSLASQSVLQDCPTDIIQSLSSQNIFERMVVCSTDGNFAGSAECLDRFPRSIINELLALSAPCRECYLDFISQLQSFADEARVVCGVGPIDPPCLQLLYNRGVFNRFQDCTGISLLHPSCTSSEVRNRNIQDLSTQLVGVLRGKSLQVPVGPCDIAYLGFFVNFKSAIGVQESAIYGNSTCILENSSNITKCLSAFPDILRDFRNSAGFDIWRKGPECTAQELVDIDRLFPFQTLMNCAFQPGTTLCDINSVYEKIHAVSSDICLACYKEFFSALEKDRAVFSAHARCDIPSDTECVNWVGNALQNVADCTGAGMKTDISWEE